MRLQLSLVTAAALWAGALVPATAQAEEPTTANPAPISAAVYYNPAKTEFGVSEDTAADLGYSPAEITEFNQNLAELTPGQSQELAGILGIDVVAESPFRAVPAVIWVIAGVVGGAAADEIIGQVTNWGVSGACRNLEGNWSAFDDFCRSNGHI